MEEGSVLLISMPYADITVPSIQLALLETYLKTQGINVSSLHLYLFAAEAYGLEQYSNLIHSPNDPYVSQLIFSKYVFPDHWQKKKNEIKKFYEESIQSAMEKTIDLPFNEYEEKTDSFISNIMDGIDWNGYDLIGFSLNYGQILPSLAVAKQIKEKYPEKRIVLGGSSTLGNLGKRFIDQFDYIDYVISGEGEIALAKLAKNNTIDQSINNVLSKNKYTCTDSTTNSCVDLNSLPFLDFTSFYQQLSMSSPEIQQYFSLNGRMPIELSRGCWWNNCNFCNQKAFHNKYKEKNIDRFIEELSHISSSYNILSFQIIGSVLPPNNLKKLCKKIISMDKDLQFIAEARADRLQEEDYFLLKKAGFHIIQTGIESFSSHYIKKMSKGVRVIDNIAALKHSRQYQIKNEYNLIINYPNEEPIDYIETKENTKLLMQYLEPPRLSPFIVSYQSHIYNNIREHNISEIIPKNIDQLLYPNEFIESAELFFYDFKRITDIEPQKWEQIVSTWNSIRKNQKIKTVQTGNIIDDLIFYYEDGGSFLKIYDKRSLKDVNIFMLDEHEREVFLSCKDVIRRDRLIQNLNCLSEQKIDRILSDLVKNNIIFKEDESFLSLPLCLRTYLGFNQPLDFHEKKTKSILLQK